MNMMERSCRIVKKNTFDYSKNMEEKRKNIKDLEQKKQGELHSVNLQREDLGEALLSRAAATEGGVTAQSAGAQRAEALFGEYQRIRREIADNEGLISAIKEDVLRLKQTDEALSGNDRALRALTEELRRFYTGLGEKLLGERLLGEKTHGEFTEPYGPQLEALEDKVKALENRLEALDARPPANFVVQLGRNAEALLLRSNRGKARESLRRLYETVGENFARGEAGEPEAGGEIALTLGEIGELRKRAGDLRAEGLRLQEERRRIADSLNVEGGPVKRTAAIEKHLCGLKTALRGVYGEYGELAREKARAGEWDAVFEEGDRPLLQTIEDTRSRIEDIERQIKKLEASAAIDEEQKAIARMEKAISDHRGRIATAEKAVGDLEERIRGAKQRIEELKQIEAYGSKN
ncbi:MAG: hypothetical protein LBL19_03745 [Spirochaetaceae bacterium]|nr:hypothetical protein [Spirochaetaceae bacterium]